MINFELSTSQQIGIGLAAFGIFFILFGVVLLFDPGLIAIGNIYLIVGSKLIIGVKQTLVFFFEFSKLKGSILFFGGFYVVFLGYPIFGMIVEGCGFVLLGFLPRIVSWLRSISQISIITYLPGIRQILHRLAPVTQS